jgi:hypothetical protein
MEILHRRLVHRITRRFFRSDLRAAVILHFLADVENGIHGSDVKISNFIKLGNNSRVHNVKESELL